MANATEIKFGDPATRIAQTERWSVLVRPRQPTLGSLVLVCREPVVAFADVSAEGFAELRGVIGNVERMLRADLNVQRTYRSASVPEVIWMYVGYYGTRRGGRPEHTPDVCYPSAGWRVESSEVWAGASDPGLRANEMVVERRGRRRLVHYWYRSARSAVLLGLLPVSVDQLRSRVSTGRADGALVTLSTPLEAGALEAARSRLIELRRPLETELAARWPVESPRS